MELGAALQLAKFDNVLQQLAALTRGERSALWDGLLDIQFSLLDYFRGDWTSALQHAKAACRHDSGTSVEGFGAGILCFVISLTQASALKLSPSLIKPASSFQSSDNTTREVPGCCSLRWLKDY